MERFGFAATRLRSIPTYENIGFRIELWGDEVEKLSTFDPLTGDEFAVLDRLTVYPEEPLRNAASAIGAGCRND